MLGHSAFNTDPPGQITPLTQGENRFSDSTPQQPTVVESAMQLSEKYAALSERAELLRQKNDQLSAENRLLKEKYTTTSAELKQAQKELAESNKLLLDMRVELNNWKNNILGFRDEMRQADIEQLKAILQILTILGGNTSTDPNSIRSPEDKTPPPLLSCDSKMRGSKEN